MKDRNLVDICDSIGPSPSKQTLFTNVLQLIDFLKKNPEITEGLLHKQNVILEKNCSLDYVLKRVLNGTTVENQQTQTNYLFSSFAIISTFKTQIPPKKLIHYVLENCSPSNAVNKTEKQFFCFSALNLLFKIYELYADCEDKQIFNRVKVFIVEQTKKNQFMKSFLAGVLESTTFFDDFHVDLIEKIIPDLNPNSSYDLELLIKIKLDCLEAFRKMTDPTLKKSVSKITSETNNHLKEVYSGKFLSKLFESVNKDENFQENDRISPIYEKLAQLYVSHKDLKIKSIFEYFSLISKTDGQHSPAFGNKLAHFCVFFTHLMSLSANLNNFISLIESSENSQLFSQIMHTLLGTRYNKCKKFVIASSFLQTKLSNLLISNAFPTDRFQLFLLNLIYDQKDLSSLHFPIKDVLLHKLNNQDVKTMIIEKLLSNIDNFDYNQKLSGFKALVSKICIVLPTISNDILSKKCFFLLFQKYVKAKTIALLFTEDLKEHTKEYISEAIKSFIFERIVQVILRKPFRKILKDLVEKWLEVNSIEDEFMSLQIVTDLELLQNKKSENLILINLILLFQNYQSEEQSIESLIFNQSIEDVVIFSQNFVSSEGKLDSSDFKIFTDVLISLLNCPSSEMRAVVKESFDNFLNLLDESIFELIENAVFTEVKTGAENELMESEQEDLDESIENEVDEQNGDDDSDKNDENSDDEDIIIDGQIF